jgi:hypothetical protein
LLFKELLQKSSRGLFVLHDHINVGRFQQAFTSHHFVWGRCFCRLLKLPRSVGGRHSRKAFVLVFNPIRPATILPLIAVHPWARRLSSMVIIYLSIIDYIPEYRVLQSAIVRFTSVVRLIQQRIIRVFMNVEITFNFSGILY